MCEMNLSTVDEHGLPRLLHCTFTPTELDYIRIGLIGNVRNSILAVVSHAQELDEFKEEHDAEEIHNAINIKLATLFGLELCSKCDEFHNRDCEAHNEICGGFTDGD